MFQLTIKKGDAIQHQACFMTVHAAEVRSDHIRGTFPRGVLLKIEVVELCDECSGRGFVQPRNNKKYSRPGLTEPCKVCNKTGIVGDVLNFEGD